MRHADLVLFNGTVFRGVGKPVADAIALCGNRIAGIGTIDDLDMLIHPATKKIDLAGRAIVPGFIDSHLHPIWYGLDALQVDLSPATSVPDIVERLAASAGSSPHREWIVGVGYDQAKLLERRHPTAAELQSAVPGRPVVAYRTCRHMAVASPVALEKCRGLPPQQDHGTIVRGEDGSPTGLLQEAALELLAAAMPPLTVRAIGDALERTSKECLSYGITTVTDAAVGMRAGTSELEAYLMARKDGRLNTRAELALLAGPLGLDRKLLMKPPIDDDEWLWTGPLKLFMDGAAGAGTARMKDPYERGGAGPDRCGLFCLEEDYIREIVPDFIAAGKAIMTHAIGDAAIDRTLDMLTATPRPRPALHRHRIEHVTFARADQIRRMSELGIAVSVQPLVIHQSGDLYAEILGDDRARRTIPIRDLIESGIRPAASSDAPISSLDPLVNLRSMVTRRTVTGRVLGPEQILNLESAIGCLTENAALIGFRGHELGTLEVGKLGDLAVLSADPFRRPETLDALQVDMTLLDGKIVHERQG